jgi:hypothetical protein
MSNRRYIELYSGNRNRELYPEPASFEVPFESTIQNLTGNKARDPIVMGTINYKFITASSKYFVSVGKFGPGSTPSAPVLSLAQTGEKLSTIPNYYVGWYIVDTTDPELTELLITGYNASTATLTLIQPFPADITGHEYGIYSSNPTPDYISIPTLDINNNYILNYELAYNGYYVIFESANPLYSNPANSNIFYRTITYYDSATQIAYFDTPLPDGYNPEDPQTFTLRRTLPMERWTLSTPTFINTTPPANPSIGPLIGPVITLSADASPTDNFYVGKYVYYYSNAPETYKKIFPPAEIINDNGNPVSGVFFPVYGAYYIKAYNGTTKQLSVMYDINNTPLPTYIADIGYDSSSFVEKTDITITQIGATEYRGTLTDNTKLIGVMDLSSMLYTMGKTYQITWNIKGKTTAAEPYFEVSGLNNTILYTSSTILDSYTEITFTIIPTSSVLCFAIYADTEEDYYIEWDSFVMSQVDTINISCFDKDNFCPLSYTGSMLSINEAVCYEISLLSLTLPNQSLMTGSRISFYPYVYVEFSNATSPTGASRELIYSNNPNSGKALFIAPITQTVQPLLSTFMMVGSNGMSQIVKFKPNDNLRFSVYLPDGSLFETIENDVLSPYPSLGRVQIDAVFSIRRI